MRLIACFASLFVALGGCAPYGYGRRPSVVYTTASGFVLVRDDRSFCAQCLDASEPVYVNVPVPAVARPAPAPAPPPRRFDGVRARSVLGDVDLSACAEPGGPHGYGHAFVTFADEGYATKVVIDRPAGLSPEAVECIGHALGAVQVPAFDGPKTTVGISWRVP